MIKKLNIHFKRDLKSLVNYMMFLISQIPNNEFDKDDLIFIGMEAIIKAEKNFDPNRNVLFTTYAKKIIFNDFALLTNKQKREKDIFKEENQVLYESIRSYDPTSEYDSNILLSNIYEKFTIKEDKVIQLLLKGCRISDITEQTAYTYKEVDNAMQSIKRKIKNS